MYFDGYVSIASLCQRRRIEYKPTIGPGSSIQATATFKLPHNEETISIETIVKLKPIQFIIASAPPTCSAGQARAAKDENCGESAATNKPQTIIAPIKACVDSSCTSGMIKHINPEPTRAQMAIFALPQYFVSAPPIMQPTPEIANTTNDTKYICLPLSEPLKLSITGTNAKNAYSSHIWPKYPNAVAR